MRSFRHERVFQIAKEIVEDRRLFRMNGPPPVLLEFSGKGYYGLDVGITAERRHRSAIVRRRMARRLVRLHANLPGTQQSVLHEAFVRARRLGVNRRTRLHVPVNDRHHRVRVQVVDHEIPFLRGVPVVPGLAQHQYPLAVIAARQQRLVHLYGAPGPAHFGPVTERRHHHVPAQFVPVGDRLFVPAGELDRLVDRHPVHPEPHQLHRLGQAQLAVAPAVGVREREKRVALPDRLVRLAALSAALVRHHLLERAVRVPLFALPLAHLERSAARHVVHRPDAHALVVARQQLSVLQELDARGLVPDDVPVQVPDQRRHIVAGARGRDVPNVMRSSRCLTAY